MAIFPKIQSPCPYKGEFAAILDGSMCRICKREVVDITAMSDGERVALIAGCKDEICVKYAFPVRPAIAAVVLAAAAIVPGAAAACEVEVVVLTGGGIKDPANVQYIQVPDAKPAPALPVIYEPAKPVPAPVTAKAPA